MRHSKNKEIRRVIKSEIEKDGKHLTQSSSISQFRSFSLLKYEILECFPTNELHFLLYPCFIGRN
jgi:hypothetical protein